MVTIFMSLSLTISMLFVFLSHPITMGSILMVQTILIALTTGFLTLSYWYSYILFLIMIGGMLILFIYMTSVASNEKIKYSNKMMLLIILLMSIGMALVVVIDTLTFIINVIPEDSYNFSPFYIPLSKFMNPPSIGISVMLIIYLLVTLIAVVKITNVKYGPLRHMN